MSGSSVQSLNRSCGSREGVRGIAAQPCSDLPSGIPIDQSQAEVRGKTAHGCCPRRSASWSTEWVKSESREHMEDPLTLSWRVYSVGSWVNGADIQDPGLEVLSLNYEILEDLCIHNTLHSKPDTYLSPNRCLLIDPLLSSLSSLVHTRSVSGDIYFFVDEVAISPWSKPQVRTVMENNPQFLGQLHQAHP